jgi:hypothetical protein
VRKLTYDDSGFPGEIPGLYGSLSQPRPSYEWYEQYHVLGPDCAKVHKCDHGLCHACHAKWHMDWVEYGKKKDAFMEALEDPDAVPVGSTQGGSDLTSVGHDPQPPTYGNMRTHPARIAKRRLGQRLGRGA